MTREFYYKRAGAQIDNLACPCAHAARASNPTRRMANRWLSRRDIKDVARDFLDGQDTCMRWPGCWRSGDADDTIIRRFAGGWLRREQDLDRVPSVSSSIDVYFLESSHL